METRKTAPIEIGLGVILPMEGLPIVGQIQIQNGEEFSYGFFCLTVFFAKTEFENGNGDTATYGVLETSVNV